MAVKHVIVGAGPAGTYAIDTIRALDPEAEITLVCDEPAYARMALPYFLAGQVPEAQTLTADDAYFQRQRVNALIGVRATVLDTSKQELGLSDGRRLTYDRLLLATGSTAQRLDIPGADEPGVETLWTLADANAALANTKSSACLIGAGFIGFIILNALHKRGLRLSVVEIADHVLPRMLDADAAKMVEGYLVGQGIDVRTGQEVSAIRAGSLKNVVFKSGESVSADLVVLATGIRANTELARAAGIETGAGIRINQRCQTSAPGVYAAGDCAEGLDLLTGDPVVHAIQPTAVDHGRVAGANMAGKIVDYPGSLSLNILDVCGLQCASFGRWDGTGLESQVISNPDLPIYRKIVWDGDRIVGAIFAGPMNDVCMLNDVGMVKGFIQTRAELERWKEYIYDFPADLRRPYVGAGIPAMLVEQTLLGAPAEPRVFRYQNREPLDLRTKAHAQLVGSKS